MYKEIPPKNRHAAPILFATTFIISCMLYLKADFQMSWDICRYLNIADTFLKGGGLTYIGGESVNERHLFILLLAGILQVSGGSILACTTVLSVTAAFYPVLAAALAKQMFGFRTAWATAILMVSSPILVYWAPRHIDAIWPLPLLACLYLLLSENAGRQYLRGVACALLAASALFLKETAVLFLPVPLLVCLAGQLPGGWRRAAGFYGAIAPPMVLWLVLLVTSGTVNQNPMPFGNVEPESLFRLAMVGLGRYFGYQSVKGLANQFILAPLFYISLIFLLFTQIKRRSSDKGKKPLTAILATLVCFLPFDAMQSYFGWRISQNLLSVAMWFIGLAAVLVRLGDYSLLRITPTISKNLPGNLPLFLLLLLCISIQVVGDIPKAPGIWENTLAANIFVEPRLKTSTPGTNLHQWLSVRYPSGCAVMLESYPESYLMPLLGPPMFQPVNMPRRVIVHIARAMKSMAMKPLNCRMDGPLMIYSHSGHANFICEKPLIIFGATEVLKALRQEKVRLAALYRPEMRLAASVWFADSPEIKYRETITDIDWPKVDFYEVINREGAVNCPKGPPLIINRPALEYLRWLERNRPEYWVRVRSTLLEFISFLNAERLTELMEGKPATWYRLI